MDIIDDLWRARNKKYLWFIDIIDGYEIKKLDDYENLLFYTKNNEILFYYNTFNHIINISRNKFMYMYSNIHKETIIYIFDTYLEIKETYFIWESTYSFSYYEELLRNEINIRE